MYGPGATRMSPAYAIMVDFTMWWGTPASAAPKTYPYISTIHMNWRRRPRAALESAASFDLGLASR